ncbi:MAG: DNA recombination protein RmuC [Pseudomonadota bacterium]
MQQILFFVGERPVTVFETVITATGLGFLCLVIILIALLRSNAASRQAEAEAQSRAREIEAQITSLTKLQSEMTGRMQTMAEVFGSRQSDLVTGLSERLDRMSQRMGQSMSETTQRTAESLSKVHERLAVIDNAQANIRDLSGQVGQLQQILSNKQTRGAFGQGRMEAIIQDGLPHGSFSLQATLSNGRRPDCLIYMPNDVPPLVIDAKFPLEAWTAFREADSDALGKAAAQRFRQDIDTHVKHIRERYQIPGETQDTAFMFVPSESIFADLHEHFDDLIQKAHRNRVVIVSPSLLMLSIQVVQAVLKDARMREQAHIIQTEVLKLVEDVNRLDDRVRKLQSHFGQASKDIDQILISTDKVMKRGSRIEALDFEDKNQTASEDQGQLLAGE